MSETESNTPSPLFTWLVALIFVGIFMLAVGVMMLSAENPLAIFQMLS